MSRLRLRLVKEDCGHLLQTMSSNLAEIERVTSNLSSDVASSGTASSLQHQRGHSLDYSDTHHGLGQTLDSAHSLASVRDDTENDAMLLSAADTSSNFTVCVSMNLSELTVLLQQRKETLYRLQLRGFEASFEVSNCLLAA